MIKELQIDQTKFSRSNQNNWIWKNDCEAESVKLLSPYFENINNQNLHSIFIVFCCVVALFSSPVTATADKNMIYKAIMKLLKGKAVASVKIIGLLTVPFMSAIAAILVLLGEGNKLKTGPKNAHSRKNSIIFLTGEVAKVLNQQKELLPTQFLGINIPCLLSYVEKKISLIKSKENKQMEVFESIEFNDECPNIQNI